MQIFLCITLVAHALALGRQRIGGVVISKNPFTSVGGVFSSTTGVRELTGPPSQPRTQPEDFLYDNAASLQLFERGSHLPIETTPLQQREPLPRMVHPDDPEHGGLDDHDFIRKRMPPWAMWEEDVWVDPDTGREYPSEPCLWVNVTDSLRLDDSGNYWISEHGLKSGYTDLLRLEDKTFTSTQRPWRSWEGCRFFGEVLNKGRAYAREKGLTVDVMIKKGGKTYQRTKPPTFACFS